MITATDLFGRPCVTKNERQILDAARQSAKNMWNNRNETPYKENLPANVTIEYVEDEVVKAVCWYRWQEKRGKKNK